MRVAVIGAGLFGCTTAIIAARRGHDVHIYESAPTIMGAASAVNQFRLHRGYHYPRSPETATECLIAGPSFYDEYGASVIDGRTVYAIARDSRTSGKSFVQFCNAHGLECSPVELESARIETAFEVSEGRIDHVKLKNIVASRLADVSVHLNVPGTRIQRSEFDIIIIACYAGINEIAAELGCQTRPLQYEIIEKPVIRLPERFRQLSVVVMDGEYCCVDPYGTVGLHLLGHVKHGIHHSNVGLSAEIPHQIAKYINRGVVDAPGITRFSEIVASGVEFIPELAAAEHVGSMFTVRAVLPGRDETDERPTLVDALDGQVIRVFSGKLVTSVVAAEKVLSVASELMQEAA